MYLGAFYSALRNGTYDDNTTGDNVTQDNMTEKTEGERNMKENKGIDWVAKLSSRKFWLAVTGLISGLMLAFGADENTVNSVTGVVMAGASVLAYIIGEAWADAAAAENRPAGNKG